MGSGKIITMPLITDDGRPTTNQSMYPEAEAEGSQTIEQNTDEGNIQNQKVIQWKLSLHQIGNIFA